MNEILHPLRIWMISKLIVYIIMFLFNALQQTAIKVLVSQQPTVGSASRVLVHKEGSSASTGSNSFCSNVMTCRAPL